MFGETQRLAEGRVGDAFFRGRTSGCLAPAWAGQMSAARFRSRVRPGDAAWPSAARWDALNRNVGGRLLGLQSPFASRGATPTEAAGEALKQLKNPFYIGDQPG